MDVDVEVNVELKVDAEGDDNPFLNDASATEDVDADKAAQDPHKDSGSGDVDLENPTGNYTPDYIYVMVAHPAGSPLPVTLPAGV